MATQTNTERGVPHLQSLFASLAPEARSRLMEASGPHVNLIRKMLNHMDAVDAAAASGSQSQAASGAILLHGKQAVEAIDVLRDELRAREGRVMWADGFVQEHKGVEARWEDKADRLGLSKEARAKCDSAWIQGKPFPLSVEDLPARKFSVLDRALGGAAVKKEIDRDRADRARILEDLKTIHSERTTVLHAEDHLMPTTDAGRDLELLQGVHRYVSSVERGLVGICVGARQSHLGVREATRSLVAEPNARVEAVMESRRQNDAQRAAAWDRHAKSKPALDSNPVFAARGRVMAKVFSDTTIADIGGDLWNQEGIPKTRAVAADLVRKAHVEQVYGGVEPFPEEAKKASRRRAGAGRDER